MWIIFLILLVFVVYINRSKIENMVVTDSTYSDCKVGCLIACNKRSNSTGDSCLQVDKDCFNGCVDQCWNF